MTESMTPGEGPTGLRKWADEHQYDAEPQPGSTADNGVMPSVRLLYMQDDPLGVLAAQNSIYTGKVVRSLAEVTDKMRRDSFEDMMKTTLQSPLESIKMHWLIEGVDRAFTHQLVRQRTANYGQESLRFSVVGPLIDSTTLPPDLHGTQQTEGLDEANGINFLDMINSPDFGYATQEDRNRTVWDWCIMQIDAAYHYLAEHGMAAEEARGLLPHATATRIHYQTDLRALMKVMGERLCTQAQFHWRLVAAMIREAIRNYMPDFSYLSEYSKADQIFAEESWVRQHRWQFHMIADSGIFQPVCYQTGHCMFQASADRGCTIRSRVESMSGRVHSSQWGDLTVAGNDRINPEEWLLNPAAARRG